MSARTFGDDPKEQEAIWIFRRWLDTGMTQRDLADEFDTCVGRVNRRIQLFRSFILNCVNDSVADGISFFFSVPGPSDRDGEATKRMADWLQDEVRANTEVNGGVISVSPWLTETEASDLDVLPWEEAIAKVIRCAIEGIHEPVYAKLPDPP